MIGNDIKVLNKDLVEFSFWKKDKSRVKPQLRNHFQTDDEYERFMNDQKSDTLTIKDDPAILNKKDNLTGQQDQSESEPKIEVLDGSETDRVRLIDGAWRIIDRDGNPLSEKYGSSDSARLALAGHNQQVEFVSAEQKKLDDDRIKFIEDSWRVMKDDGTAWPQKYESNDEAKAAYKTARLHRDYHKDGSETRIFKGFGFEGGTEDLGAGQMTYGSVIGTLTLVSSYINLFELLTEGQPAMSAALNKFYIDNEVRSLARHIMAFHDVDEFVNVVLPGNCPLDYLKRLHTFCLRAKSELFIQSEDSGFVTQLDEISNQIAESIYRIKRAKVGYRWFAEEDKEFGKLDSTEKQAVAGTAIGGAGLGYVAGRKGAGYKTVSKIVKKHPELYKGAGLKANFMANPKFVKKTGKAMSRGGKIGLLAGGLGAGLLAYKKLNDRYEPALENKGFSMPMGAIAGKVGELVGAGSAADAGAKGRRARGMRKAGLTPSNLLNKITNKNNE
jgi:hypothetical protein